MLAVFELLLAWYRFRFLGRSPILLDSQPQSFLSIATVAWFQENSWPKVQNALATISDIRVRRSPGSWHSMFFLKVPKKTRSLAVRFRPVPGGDALLPGHNQPKHCLSVSPPRSVSVGQLALGWHAVCYPNLPCLGPNTMHQFSNALGEHRRSSTNHRLWVPACRCGLLPTCQPSSFSELSLPMLLPAPSLCLRDSSSLGGFSSLSRSGSQSSSLMLTTCKSLSNVRGGWRACEGCELRREWELVGCSQ